MASRTAYNTWAPQKPTLFDGRYLRNRSTLDIEQMLCTVERKILRIIYGPIQDKGRRRPRWNSVIYNLYKDLNIVDDNIFRRLRWEGYVIRMENKKIPKKVLNGKLKKNRQVGKPKIRWEDVIRRDTSQILGIRGWSRRAEDGEEWKQLLRGDQGPEGAVAS